MTEPIINKFSIGNYHEHGCCIAIKFTVTTDNPMKLAHKVFEQGFENMLKTGNIYKNYLITVQNP